MKKIIICGFFGLMVQWFNGLIPLAHAQSTTLSVSPPVVEILLAPNKKVEQTFTLQTTGENLEITPELHLAIPSDSSGHMIVDPSPLIPSSLPLAFTISQNGPVYTLTLEAANVDITQDVYLALVFRAPPSPYSIPNTSYTIPGISSLILVTINPTGVMPVGLEIQDFDPPLFHDSWDPLSITPQLENKTDIMIRPQGKYEIISPSGKTVLALPLYPNLILGKSSRQILGSPDNPRGYLDNPSQTPGVISNPLPLTWTPTWSALGPHRLRLTITTEGGTQITQVEKVIWILPIRLMVIIIVLLALFITVLVTRGKSLTPPLTDSPKKHTVNV